MSSYVLQIYNMEGEDNAVSVTVIRVNDIARNVIVIYEEHDHRHKFFFIKIHCHITALQNTKA